MSDLDGDNKPDMVVANATDGTVSVLCNLSSSGIGAASFAAKIDFTVGTDPRAVLIKDLNGDGRPDIITANSTSNAAASIAAQKAGFESRTAGMQVYPNPTQGEFTVRLDGLKAAGATLELFDGSGKVIERSRVNSLGNVVWLPLSLRGQPAGTYYVKRTGVDGVQVIKIVMQR